MILLNPFTKIKQYRNCYYNSILDKYQIDSFYTNFFLDVEKKQSLFSEKTIVLDNKLQLNQDMTTVKKIIGTPYLQLQNKVVEKTDILLYKFLAGNQKVKHELHFFENKLFYFNFIFSYLTKDDKNLLTTIIEKKYLNNNTIDFTKHIIKDTTGNTILIEDNVDFIIHYISSSNPFFKKYSTLNNTIENQLVNKSKKQAQILFHLL